LQQNCACLKPFSIFILVIVLFSACRQQKQPVVTPWGDTLLDGQKEEVAAGFDLDDIEHSGEMIALTISGPETYYDYHGRALGLHALLCQQFADSIGVRLRMEVCRDRTELIARLQAGDADLAAYPITSPDSLSPGWQVADKKPMLLAALHKWYSPGKINEVRLAEHRLLSTQQVKRRVFSPMLNRQGGVISRYDALFQRYAQPIHWDWRLMAAQCYQESTFDPDALSWAGARGLMQIMPATADHLHLSRSQMNDPEQNIAAAARYLHELEESFADVHNRYERQNFVLAAYNGGAHHIRDAMRLAQREGQDAQSWKVVSRYVLLLSEPRYYQDPLVKNGYMRGRETVDYVRLIRERHRQYLGTKTVMPGNGSPQKSRNERHRRKYSV